MDDFNNQQISNMQNSNFNPNYNTTSYYNGGYPVRCLRCNNVVSTRVCGFCGLDLAPLYPPFAPQQQPVQSQQALYPQQFTSYQQYPPQQGYSAPYQGGHIYQQSKPPKNKMALLIIISIVAAFLFIGVISIISGISAYNTLKRGSIYDNIPNFPKDDYTASTDDYYLPGGYSESEYGKLKIGMSYAQISYIIGGDGELVNSGENLKDETFYTYAWPHETELYTVLYITFTKDAASDIMIGDEEDMYY